MNPAVLNPLPENFLPYNWKHPHYMWSILAKQWFPIANIGDVIDKPMQIVLLDVKLVIYRIDKCIQVSRDRCPHLGLPLSTGRVEQRMLVCANHGLRFDSNGSCRFVPDRLLPIKNRSLHLTNFPVLERYGYIWTCLLPYTCISILDFLSRMEAVEFDDMESRFKFLIKYVITLILSNSPALPIDHSINHQLLHDLTFQEYESLFTEIDSTGKSRFF
jgi:nitrite reductase/ring-hydroxylating ferredoxin subunit